MWGWIILAIIALLFLALFAKIISTLEAPFLMLAWFVKKINPF